MQINEKSQVEYALTLLLDSNWQVRQAAATALGQLGSNDPRALDALLKALLDSIDYQVSMIAISAVGQLGKSDPKVLNALLKALSDAYWPIKQAAATALGQLGNSDSKVISALLKALSDSIDWQVTVAAASALATLRIDQITIGQHIESLLCQHEPTAHGQFTADYTVDSLLLALEQVAGEV